MSINSLEKAIGLEMDWIKDLEEALQNYIRRWECDHEVILLPSERGGDFSTPLAFSLARPLKRSPQSIAEELSTVILAHPGVEKVDVVNGYINVHMNSELWKVILKSILQKGLRYGLHTFGQNEAVNIEYVSANPTGPLHAAHSRVAILGDIVANLLEAVGYRVTREYFINDAGQQIRVLGHSVFAHYKALVHSTTAMIEDGMYPGDYVRDIAEKFLEQEGEKWLSVPEEQWFPVLSKFSIKVMMLDIQQDLTTLGIHHDVFTSEEALVRQNLTEKTISILEQKGLVYRGFLPPPKGKTQEEWDPQELLLFRSTAFGDEQDRPLQRPDGAWTYFANDIAYHWNKAERSQYLIDVWGADHGSHVHRMQAALSALTDTDFSVLLCQIVHFYNEGVLLKMSKRAGTFVTLRDVLSFIDKDILRFMMLTKKADTHLDLDIVSMKAQTKDNPVFYVQYAYARCCSVLRAAKDLFSGEQLSQEALQKADFSLLQDFSLIKLLADWPRQVKQAAIAREPHRIALYLSKVAQQFHGLWQQGTSQSALRFLQKDNLELSYTHIALVQAVAFVIASGLLIFGITPREELRS